MYHAGRTYEGMQVSLCDLWRIKSLPRHRTSGYSARSLAQLFWLVGTLLFELFCFYYTSGILWYTDVNLDNFELLEKKFKADRNKPLYIYTILDHTIEQLNLKLFSVGENHP